MRSSPVNSGDAGTAAQYDNLRDDAYGGSQLLAHQQGTANMTLYVEPGVVYIGATRVIFGGGNSPTITAPASHPRIDILTIDSSGTLAITQGTEAASPVVPSYPTNKAVLCEIYNRVGETSVKDADDSSNGYISNDVRPFIAPIYISSTSQFGSAVVPDSALVSSFVHAPSSPAQGDILYYNGTAYSRLPAGTSGLFLETQGSSANPQWASAFSAYTNITVVYMYLDGPSVGTSTTTPTKFHELQFSAGMVPTSFNVVFDLKGNTGVTGYAQIYKNGVAYGTLQSVTGSIFSTFSQSLSFTGGDLCQLYIYSGTAATGIQIQNFGLQGLPIPTVFVPTKNS
jgi:hypothetical protein